MKLSDLVATMESIAPTRYAESWDNVGLLAGDPDQPLSRTLLTIDLTTEVAAEAKRLRCDSVIAYHPPIFQPLKRISHDSPVATALRNGIAVYSPHTAWDVADGGANDSLAAAMALTDVRPLKPSEGKSTQYKLVVFIPDAHVDGVSDALFQAGAGRIGNYTRCSYQSPGVGTFQGNEGANPRVGKRGHFETVDEIRVETIVPIARLQPVLSALRESHPYEEPAFDLVPLAALPEGKGIGRIGRAAKGATRQSVIQQLKRSYRLKSLLIAGPRRGPVGSVALCAGAGRDLLDLAIKEKADVYVTGELPHHDALRAARAGLTVLCTLHSNSERPSLRPLAGMIRKKLPALRLFLSKVDRDPFEVL